jgi:D-lyxose ketol-isomerase
MISRAEFEAARGRAWELAAASGLPLRAEEREGIEVAELGLGELERTGLQILTMASTDWVGVKLLILTPNQFFPQHRHPPGDAGCYPGKTELLRGQSGRLWLYVPGPPAARPRVEPPAGRREYCTVWHEVEIGPGQQYICPPNSWHWFQAGPEGAVVWSISSKVTDTADQFSDPRVVRKTQISED